jgi:hypothetical protein
MEDNTALIMVGMSDPINLEQAKGYGGFLTFDEGKFTMEIVFIDFGNKRVPRERALSIIK